MWPFAKLLWTKPGCRAAQLVKRLVTSGYPDGSSSGGPVEIQVKTRISEKFRELPEMRQL